DEMIINVPSINNEDVNLETNFTEVGTNKIKVNKADIDELVNLTVIGPSKAKAIITYRDEIVGFKNVDDLLEETGIGEKTLETNSTEVSSNKIKVNQADIDELVNLTGIGPSKAEAIITYRDEIGGFKNVDDLLEVTGIGEKTLETIRDELQIP